MSKLEFSDVQIQNLFGHEAAEDENPERLRQYYFKTTTYTQVTAALPLRIVVGHKGIGKSALFSIAMAEDVDNGELPILIKPDDISDLETDVPDFLKSIRLWKDGLSEIIASKVLGVFGLDESGVARHLKNHGGRLLSFLEESFKNIKPIDYAPAKQAAIKSFLKNNRIRIYIDDLDRGWQGRRHDVSRISALLNAVRDIANESRGVSFKVGLRSDVYYLVRTSDESTDKIEGSVVWLSWTNHEILVLLVKRIETFFGRSVDERRLKVTRQGQLARYLENVMEPRFLGSGLWENAPIYRVLMSLIRKRPRDLVKLCTLAARRAQAAGSVLIRTDHFRASFEEYSQGRIQDTINEFRSELPDIEKLLMNMKPNKRERTAKQGYVYSTSALLSKVNNVQQSQHLSFAGQLVPPTSKELAAFMYKINFLTARKIVGRVVERRYFEENRYLLLEFADFGFDWEVHPAYRWALQAYNMEEIFENLYLSADDN